jgi:hypothetical protein
VALGHDGGEQTRPGREYYGALGLAPDATSEDIRAAYQRLVGEIVAGHAAAEGRPAIEQAFETLGDPIRRLRYDAQANAPPPPRFQLPEFRFRGRRHSVPPPRRRSISRLVLAGAIGLVVIVGLIVLLRGRSGTGQPAESVADLVSSPTATTVSQPGAAAAARPAQPPISGQTPGGLGTSGSLGLLPFPLGPGASVLAPPSPPGAQPSEPPFLTGSAIVDMLRAVAAAAAVRNGPAQGAGVPVGVPSNVGVQPNPAGVPITGIGALPPIVGASQPSPGGETGLLPGASLPATAPQVATPPPTPTPRPNRIAVPAGPVTTNGATSVAGTPRASVAPTNGPNRRVPPTPTVSR